MNIPPLDIRLNVGPFNDEASFLDWGKFEFDRLVKYGNMTENSSVLDLGCGCGRIALHCTDYLKKGSYEGIDTLKTLIDWCKQNIQYSNFKFSHIDVHSERYNLGGIQASKVSLPFEDNSFDLVFAISLFTHMFQADMSRYFKEVARILRPSGRLYATYFFSRDSTSKADSTGDESMIVYREKVVLQLLNSAKLFQSYIEYGNWDRGAPQAFTPFQDTLVVQKQS